MAQASDLGIDLGTANVLIYMKGRGIVLREPAVVAVERDSRELLAVGDDAYRMLGRTPGNVIALRPIRNGSVVDFELCRRMLQYLVTKVIGRRLFSRPRAVLSMPTGVIDLQKRALLSAMFDTGMRRTDLLERPIAAALGVGLPFEQAYGTMLVDIGAGATEAAILSMGEVAVANEVPMGGDQFDEAIIKYLRRKYNLLVGERTAEELKINIGCCVPRPEDVAMEVTGRNLISGLPKTITVTTGDIYEALKEPTAAIIEVIQSVLEHTPPQLANDVFAEGIVLTGGGAMLQGLSEAIYNVLHIPCGPADDPDVSVVLGCGRVVEEMNELKHLLSTRRRG